MVSYNCALDIDTAFLVGVSETVRLRTYLATWSCQRNCRWNQPIL